MQLPMEEVDLLGLAEEVKTILEPSAREKNVSVEVCGNGFSVLGVRRLLYEILYNLCDNAIKYNVPNGSVRILLEDRKLTVKDTGIGISKEHHRRIFERFYRVDKSHSRETGGTGLGLSIAKHAAQRLNAGIELDSTVGEGTEIRVTF